MMKRNLLYIAIMGVVCLVASCAEDNFEPIVSTPGEDVVFAINANSNPMTKTLYGPEVNTNGETDAIMDSTQIYWVHGDSISVYGSTCLAGRKQAVYSVSTAVLDDNGNETDEIITTQNYASLLKKRGETGVQWGEGSSNFYAVYPSSDAVSFTDDGVITASINATQNYIFELGNNTTTVTEGTATHTVKIWEGTHFGSDRANPSMQNAIMFARTENASPTADAVNLLFKPFSTVLKLRFLGFLSSLGTNAKAYVQNITITAPYDIAGDFTFSTSGSGATATAEVKSSTNTSKSITINTLLPGGGYLPLENLQAVEFNVFTIPAAGIKISENDTWTITVQVQGYKPFTYTLKPKTAGNVYTLEPSKIHKIQIPHYTSLTTEPWDPTQWITQIPKPVYLSELSVPGAWYCMDDGYQGSIGLGSDTQTYTSTDKNNNSTATSWYTVTNSGNGIDDGLENLYFNGVRAFNIDCRISKSEDTNDGWFPGTESTWTDSNYKDGNSYLACSGTEKWDGFSSAQYVNDGVYVSDALKALVELAKAHPEEYIVVVITFAEKPKENSRGIYGTVNPVYITEQLNIILSTSGIVEYLYTDITPNTTIEDVISSGKNVIVKINHSNVDFATSTNPSFAMPAGIMASFASMAMSGYIHNNVTDITQAEYASYYKTMQSYPIYNGKTANNMTYYYHQAQKTESSTTASGSTYPSVYDRLAAVDSVLVYATKIYDNSSHNALFQIGIGGSVDDSPSTLAKTINPEVQKLIEEKLENDPSPLGFVLMNEALNTTYGLPLVNAIMEMNGKFYLNREGGQINTGGSTQNNQQSIPTANAAYAYVGESAF